MMEAPVNSLTDAGRRMPRHNAVDIGQHVKRRRDKPEVAERTRQRKIESW
jgi:hypothetical protein